MHFYCFLPFLSSDFTDFSVSSVSSVVFLSPIQEFEPGATPCRGGRCATRYPLGPQQPANKNTVDYDVVPADGVEPPQGHTGRGMG